MVQLREAGKSWREVKAVIGAEISRRALNLADLSANPTLTGVLGRRHVNPADALLPAATRSAHGWPSVWRRGVELVHNP